MPKKKQDEESLDGLTHDIGVEKVQALKELFPEIFSDGKIDAKKIDTILKSSLGEDVVAGEERYRLDWAGKHKVFEEIAKRTSCTLTPDRERSVDFDNSENIFIEGENLEVLRCLQKAYHNKIKMIYIDPPYNTGKDFVYNDNFRESLDEYCDDTCNVDDDGNLAKAYTLNGKEKGHYHSNWLNMMYPRLYLARNLLKDDGVIFVSIDDNEVHNLRMIMNEIFGEENFIECLGWQKVYSPKNQAKNVSNDYEYVLMFAKNLAEFNVGLLPRTAEMNKRYKNPDNDPRGDWKPGDLVAAGERTGGHYPIKSPVTEQEFDVPAGKHWAFSEVRMREMLLDNRIYFGKKGDAFPSFKQFLSEVKQGRTPSSLLLYKDYGHTDESKKELVSLFGEQGKVIFETVKPTRLISGLSFIAGVKENEAILDFFAGSASTAHAVMKLNAEDGGNRKYICVQLPEQTPEKSPARDARYDTISEIAIDRIIRAGKKIKEDHPDYDGDLGVRVYKQTDSHFPQWHAKSFQNDQALQQSIQDYLEKVSVGEEEARVVEVLLKLGYDLNTDVQDHKGYVLAFDGQVVLALGDKAKLTDLESALSVKPRIVVTLDAVFKKDDDKINFALACKEQKVILQTI